MSSFTLAAKNVQINRPAVEAGLAVLLAQGHSARLLGALPDCSNLWFCQKEIDSILFCIANN
ncbi:MAG: hypothetical protein H7842_14710 [Gammaproteobacteria bacterium SHHR-1]|uniref:hypothetical protein n=1 Tax=Magnetovirga frankeli TaxID=947516 RepID=UPI0012931EEA|nr:hypothetical protein D5125_17240 [gamma proteobacterium SS-5]